MRRLVLLFGFAALAAGIWIMVSSVGAAPMPVGVVAKGQADGAGSGPALAGEGTALEDPVDVADAELERSEVEVADAGAGKDRTLVKILVTDKETGEPLPGAEVSYYESRIVTELGPAQQEEYQKIRRDPEKVTQRYGTTVLADGLGVAIVPVEEYIRTTGRRGDLYGQLNIRLDPHEDGDQEHELELETDLTLRIQVLDSRGGPATGVPVGILPHWERTGDGNQNRYLLGTSEAPNGLLTAPHLQHTLGRWKRQEPYPDGYLLRAHIPGMTEGGETFDGEAPPRDPIVMRLPPTGRVFVQAVNSVGAEVPGQIVRSVYLAIPSEEEDQNMVPIPLTNRRWTGQAMEDGRTRFDWVLVGKSFQATARVGTESLQEDFTGPLALDQDIHVKLAAQRDVYILSGRVVDQQREPLRSSRVRMRYRQTNGMSGGRTLQLDADGTFKTYVNVGPRDEELALSLLTVEDYLSPRQTETARMYTMVGEQSLVPGENDLGDLVLTVAPLVAAGRILMNGEPWGQNPNMNVQRLEITQSRTTTRERWQAEQLSVRFPGEGRFEIRGVVQPARYRLALYDYNSTYLPIPPVEFVPGTTDLEISLNSGGSLEAVVLLDESIPLQNLWLRLTPTEGQDREARADPQDPLSLSMSMTMIGGMFPPGMNRLLAQVRKTEEERHTFLWSALWPGGYRFELLPRSARSPLVTVPDIHIVGGKNRDPRLEDIDLRGRFRRINVKVVDVEGNAIEASSGRPVVVINDPTAEQQLQGFDARDGSAEIFTAEPLLDLLVAARGYRPRELYGVGADVTVMLERFPEIAIRVAGEYLEIPENHELRASLSKNETGERDTRRFVSERGGGGLRSWLRPPTTLRQLGKNREVALQVDGDGTYTVRLSLLNPQTRRSVNLRDLEPTEIEVQTSMGSQVFEIRIPEESLKRALEQMEGR